MGRKPNPIRPQEYKRSPLAEEAEQVLAHVAVTDHLVAGRKAEIKERAKHLYDQYLKAKRQILKEYPDARGEEKKDMAVQYMDIVSKMTLLNLIIDHP